MNEVCWVVFVLSYFSLALLCIHPIDIQVALGYLVFLLLIYSSDLPIQKKNYFKKKEKKMSYISQTRHEPCSLLLVSGNVCQGALKARLQQQLWSAGFGCNYGPSSSQSSRIIVAYATPETDFHETHISQVHYWIMHVIHSATTTFVYQMSSFQEIKSSFTAHPSNNPN